jgi:hypothetical protein
MESRLKHYNIGASLYLKESDLVILDWYPPSRGVKAIRAIMDNQGRLESAAYLIRPGQTKLFEHSTLTLEARKTDSIRRSLLELSRATSELEEHETETDFEPYEPADRRGLRFWHKGQRNGTCLPNRQYFADMGIPTDLQSRFIRAFKETWDLVTNELPENVRNA